MSIFVRALIGVWLEHDLIRMWFEGGDKWDILISLVRRLGRAR